MRKSGDRGRKTITTQRLTKKINGAFGNGKEDFSRINGVIGGRGGPKAGIVIDGVIYPLEGEPPVATTHGWGQVPVKDDRPVTVPPLRPWIAVTGILWALDLTRMGRK